MPVKTGKPAPDFTLPDQDGTSHHLSDYRGRWVLAYFYPRDDTPGCTKEACAIRDNFPRFQGLDAKVLGISTDTVGSHRKFADKYELPFTLLADEEKKVVKQYGVWGRKISFGKESQGTRRMSFLIAPDGTVAKIYKKVKPAEHAAQVLADIATLSA
jgi:peroxiredoxin Q/BCP